MPVYGDESGFATESVRRYAYAPKGVPVEDQISGHRYRSTSLIAARINGSFTVPLLFEGGANAATFNAWMKQMLCPLLDETHLVILDNASFHKGKQTVSLISESGARVLF